MALGAPFRDNTMARPLNSWKEIANYLNCSARTAQRWHKAWRLPVHHPNGARGPVIANPRELDAWITRDLNGGPPPNSAHLAAMLALRDRTRANAERLQRQAERLLRQVQRATLLATHPTK